MFDSHVWTWTACVLCGLGNETCKKNMRTAHLKQGTSTDLRCGYLFDWHVYIIYIYISTLNMCSMFISWYFIHTQQTIAIDFIQKLQRLCWILSVLQNATKIGVSRWKISPNSAKPWSFVKDKLAGQTKLAKLAKCVQQKTKRAS